MTTVSDDFNRADSASLGSTSVGSVPWTQRTGFGANIGIVGNKGRLPAATISERFATIPGDVAGSVQVDVPDSTNANRAAGLTFRYIDATHWMLVYVNGSNLLVTDTAGTNYYTGTGAAGDTIRVDFDATQVEVFRNGVSVYSASNSTHSAGTEVGIYVLNFDGAGGGSADNFAWTPALAALVRGWVVGAISMNA